MRTSKEIAKTLGLDSPQGLVFVEPHSAASEQLALQQNAIVIELLLDIRDQNEKSIELLNRIETRLLVANFKRGMGAHDENA